MNMETQTTPAPVVSLRRIKMDSRRQSRRAWALARFNEDDLIKQRAGLQKETKKSGSAALFAVDDKLAQVATLKSRVGNTSPRTFDKQDSPPRRGK